jgi:hypothetical protein
MMMMMMMTKTKTILLWMMMVRFVVVVSHVHSASSKEGSAVVNLSFRHRGLQYLLFVEVVIYESSGTVGSS